MATGPVVVYLGLSIPTGADFVTVRNPSFEADYVATGGSTTPITGWTITSGSGAGVWAPTATAYPYWYTAQGNNVAWSNGGSFYQDLSETIAGNRTYTVDVLIGNRADFGIPLNGYSVSFLADGSVATPTSYMRPVPASGWWAWARTTLVVGSGSPLVGAQLGIRLWSYQGSPPGQTNFDLVTLQVTESGESPVSFEAYPDSGSYDPEDPPPWEWHYPVPAPQLRIRSVVNGVCHLEWSPPGFYRLEYDSTPLFVTPLETLNIDDGTTEHFYDCGEMSAKGFFHLEVK